MNEKSGKGYKITILILAFICAGFLIFTIVSHSKPKLEPINYGAESERINAELRAENTKLHSNLKSITDDLRVANELTGELKGKFGRAIEITYRSDERFATFENAMDNTTDIIERIEKREQRISELTSGVLADNRELRETLGIGNPGR